MRDQVLFDKIDLHLIRVLHTVLTERSVSRAALRLGMHQPAVSAALKRLRELSGDPLLVRSGSGMVPTDAGLRMIEPSASILRAAEVLFTGARGFDPQTATNTFRVAASDYLDPHFLPQLVSQDQVAGAAVPYRDPSAVGRLRLPRPSGARRRRRGGGQLAQAARKTCTWASCSPTRSSAWCPRTIPPRAAAGRRKAGWRPSTSRPRRRTPAPAA